jgi:RNA polymerase sigma factor for flagellar operon FliA
MSKRRELSSVRARLENRLGREARDPEMAAEMGLEAADYRQLVDDVQSVHHESIDDVYSEHSMWFADVEERADQALERESLRGALASAIGKLPEREAMVLQLYFVEEMNLEEIGQTLGIGAARVCQIKKTGLDRVREMLRDWN